MQTYNLDLTLTAAELHLIAENHNHYAHNYLWNDGASTWDIATLSESIGEEAIEKAGQDSQLSLSPCDLSDSGRKLFTASFLEEAADIDGPEKEQWSTPWNWDNYRDYFNAHMTPEEMGKAWAHIMISEVEE